MMKALLSFVFGVWGLGLMAQDTSYIKIHFWYGSKPAKGYKNVEGKYFGGIHGGHVTVEVGDSVYGFSPSQGARVFARKSKSNGTFHLESPLEYTFDSTADKQATVIIPVSAVEFSELRKHTLQYLNHKPYDYALFGMRCAASAHEMLSVAGIFKKRTKLFSVFYNFYPKKLRKRVFDLAFARGYKIIYQVGRKERKWEGDKRRHRDNLKALLISS